MYYIVFWMLKIFHNKFFFSFIIEKKKDKSPALGQAPKKSLVLLGVPLFLHQPAQAVRCRPSTSQTWWQLWKAVHLSGLDFCSAQGEAAGRGRQGSEPVGTRGECISCTTWKAKGHSLSLLQPPKQPGLPVFLTRTWQPSSFSWFSTMTRVKYLIQSQSTAYQQRACNSYVRFSEYVFDWRS